MSNNDNVLNMFNPSQTTYNKHFSLICIKSQRNDQTGMISGLQIDGKVVDNDNSKA